MKIHSSWHSGLDSAFAGGWRDTYFVDEHPKRTQWSVHSTYGYPTGCDGLFVVQEVWYTHPKGLQLSAVGFIYPESWKDVANTPQDW